MTEYPEAGRYAQVKLFLHASLSEENHSIINVIKVLFEHKSFFTKTKIYSNL